MSPWPVLSASLSPLPHSSFFLAWASFSLGLTIAKSLVSMMGGSVAVASQLGGGSTFSFTAVFDLPDSQEGQAAGGQAEAEAEAAPSADQQPDEEEDSFGDLRVLVAEDNKVNQFVASKILSNVGVNFKMVENGVEAVKAFEEDEHYDLILMVRLSAKVFERYF